jgi:hypothetical protein
MIFLIIYIVGFILTLIFFKLFGKKIGFDYDPPHSDGYDDWESNAHAYLSFSLGWFIVMPALLITAIFVPLYMFTKWFLRL